MLIRAGRHIARTRRYLRGFAVKWNQSTWSSTVRKQARDGDGWVKLVGDWIDRDVGDLAPSFPAGVVKDAIAAAHDEGARVTAHCFAEDTLDEMLDAGIDCIEHATGLLPRHLPRLLEQCVPIVPTLINIATFPDIAAQAGGKFPRYAAHMRSSGSAGASGSWKLLRPACGSMPGPMRAASSDTAGLRTRSWHCTTPACPWPHALDAACWAPGTWLGAEGISEGPAADVVLCAGDPRPQPAGHHPACALVLGGDVDPLKLASRLE